MKMVKLLKSLGIVIAVVVILMAVTAMLLNTDSVQNWLMQRAVTILKEHLQTEVRVGHVSVSLFKGSVTLDDVEVDDRQGRKMLRMESLTAALDGLRGLVFPGQHELVVTDARVSGLKAQLCKPASPTDTTANYQFLVEALKGQKSRKPQEGHEPQKSDKSISFLLKTATIDVDSLCYTTDNGRPRRNTGKPHHGAFDAGHLDICTAMKLKLSQQSSIVNCQLSILNFQDRGSGLQVDSLCLRADIAKDSLYLSDVQIRLPHTTLSFADGWVVVGNASERCDTAPSIRYHIPKLTATTQIRDIAQPFAPVLKGGKLPIGSIEAEMQETHYKSVAVHNLSATIVSDGAEATGRIVDQGKRIDLSCTFSFTDTDEMHKLKVKPGISFHRKKKE